MEYNFDNVIKKVEALSKKTRKELEKRHIKKALLHISTRIYINV